MSNFTDLLHQIVAYTPEAAPILQQDYQERSSLLVQGALVSINATDGFTIESDIPRSLGWHIALHDDDGRIRGTLFYSGKDLKTAKNLSGFSNNRRRRLAAMVDLPDFLKTLSDYRVSSGQYKPVDGVHNFIMPVSE